MQKIAQANASYKALLSTQAFACASTSGYWPHYNFSFYLINIQSQIRISKLNLSTI